MRSRCSPPARERSDQLPSTAQTCRTDLRLPADAVELTRARRFVRDAVTGFGLEDRAAYEFVYAVNEAVTNAIKHGRAERDGTIGLRIEVAGESIICSVRDRGPFVPPTTHPGPNLAESGRGFAFMSALTDELELCVTPGATVVRLSKRLAGAEHHGG
jgi:anti-sigma regulatory factor (Ser/Thr protein kinase)